MPQVQALALTLMLAACAKPVPVVEEALFCDVEEKRRFSQEELDWRAEHAPWNLRRDFKTNLTWERECEDGTDQDVAES